MMRTEWLILSGIIAIVIVSVLQIFFGTGNSSSTCVAAIVVLASMNMALAGRLALLDRRKTYAVVGPGQAQ